MTKAQKIIAWVSILGSGIIASLSTATTFFPDLTIILTAIGGLISALIAHIVTRQET